MNSIRLTLLLIAVLFSLPCFAQDAKKLSKEELQERIKKFKTLPKSKKQELRQRWQNFEKLPEEQRSQLRRRFRSMCRRRKDFRHRSRRLKRLNSNERGHLRHKHRKFQELSTRLVSELDKAEQERIQKLSSEQQLQFRQKLVRSHILSRRIDSFDLYDPESKKKLSTKLQSLAMKDQFELLKRESMRHEGQFHNLFNRHFKKHSSQLLSFAEKLRESKTNPELAKEKLMAFTKGLAPEAPQALLKHISRRFASSQRHRRRGGSGHGKGRRGRRGLLPPSFPPPRNGSSRPDDAKGSHSNSDRSERKAGPRPGRSKSGRKSMKPIRTRKSLRTLENVSQRVYELSD